MRSVKSRPVSELQVLVVALAGWSGGPALCDPSGAGDGLTPAAEARASGREEVRRAFGHLPLAFVENHGRTDARVRYSAQGPGHDFYLTLTRDEAVLSLVKAGDGSGVNLALRFLGADPEVELRGEERLPGEVSDFRGNDPARWQTGLPRYAAVVYRALWPRVDLWLREQDETLKYEFRLRPGARLADIRLAYAGARATTLDAAGDLWIETALGALRDSAPVAYQVIDGARVAVESRYELGDTEYGFAVGAGYDPERELVIDPGLDYSTFLGGTSNESGADIAVDATGNVYVVGITQSLDFPTTTGAFDRTLGGPSNPTDVFVSKLNSSGTALLYSTYLGGGSFDYGRAIAIDAAGNAYITGQTTSRDFPTTGGAFITTTPQPPPLGSPNDAFVAKLNATGSALVYSTFLGGGQDIDDGLGIAVDGAGNAYVTGETGSADFPTTAGAFDRTKNGAFDAYVSKLNPAGSALVYSTYLGGLEVDYGQRVALGAAGNAYVMGPTRSADFPTTPGAFDTTPNGAFDVFVLELNATGSGLVYSTRLGGADLDSGGGLALDAGGNAYVSGGTLSADFPTTPGAFDTLLNGSDAFVAKLNAAGSALVYSTFLGGSGGEGSSAIAVNAAGNAFVTGGTSSIDFPTTLGAFAPLFDGGPSDAFVSELDAAGSALVYSSFLGGTGSESGAGLALDSGGNAYVTGATFSPDFPTTAGALDRLFDGNLLIFWGDAFVSKLPLGTALPQVPGVPSLLAPANNAGPAQPIAFDWNDVAAAASYEIQIDDTSTFPAPLVAAQTTLVSQATIGALPARTLFWRVRGLSSAGVAGAWSAVRTFKPQPASGALALATLALNPASVLGGNGSTGTVTLSAAAPSGGFVVTLASANPALAVVPASVTVAFAASSATFALSTSPVTSSTAVAITASGGGVTRSASLSVTAPATGTLPAPGLLAPAADARFTAGQLVSFDWSDVSGAASYTIEIDTSSTFTVPLTLAQSVATSSFSTSALPVARMWWHARANPASGTPGTWSAARRFEVRN